MNNKQQLDHLPTSVQPEELRFSALLSALLYGLCCLLLCAIISILTAIYPVLAPMNLPMGLIGAAVVSFVFGIFLGKGAFVIL